MEETIHLLIMYTMLVLTILLFHKGRKHPPSLMLGIYASVEVVTNGLNSFTLSTGVSFFERFPFSHFIYKPIYCLWVPLFYFYFRYCQSATFRLSRKHWPHFIPFLLFLVLFFLIWIFGGNTYLGENLYVRGSLAFSLSFSVDVVVKLQYLVYDFLMIRLLIQTERHAKMQHDSFSSEVPMAISWLRFIVYGYALGSLGSIIIFVSDFIESSAVATINIFIISYYFLFFFAIFYQTVTGKTFENTSKPRKVYIPSDELENLMVRVDREIREKRLFLRSELTLQQIAQLTGEKERLISQAVNTVKGQNFNEYLNSIRIEHACHLLAESNSKPVFEVMYESGFNTKGAFNLAFKKITGKTPTQYKAEIQNTLV